MRKTYYTYAFGTEKEIESMYDSKILSKPKLTLAAVGELAGAYMLCHVFPLACLYLAADGMARIVNKGKDNIPGPGLVGLIRQINKTKK